MQKFLTGFVAFLLLIGSSASIATAQEATPDIDETETGSLVSPAVGDTVPYIAGGNEVASITVTEVIRGWNQYDEGGGPELGNDFIGFVVEAEGLTGGVVELDDSDFSLQDVNGFLYSSENVSFDEANPPVPELLDDDAGVSDGDTLEFVVVFEISDGQELAHLFWLPESDRQLTLAQLEGE